jgi:hypothetical protein
MRNKSEKEEFVVSDKRKFTAEGDLRPDVAESPREEAAPVAAQGPSSQPQQAQAQQPPAKEPSTEPGEQAMPAPPTAAEQSAQHTDYKAAGKKIDNMLDAAGAQRPADMEMTFEKLILSLYMTAMVQMGMVREEETPPRPDIISARQTIDTIALLGEKTKGNLTERESHMLQNVLFELRMAFLEITNVLTTAPPPGAPGTQGKK